MKTVVSKLLRRGAFLALLCGTCAVPHLIAQPALSAQAAPALRPPSVPLVACDPYFSIWSPADKLAGADTVHWTGKPHRLAGVIHIDGKPFRFMGAEPPNIPALPQTRLEVFPTRTIYTFEGEGVRLALTFMTPALPDDLMVYSRPVTYLIFESQSTDRKTHTLAATVYARPEIAVNVPSQEVTWTTQSVGPLTAVRIGSAEQPVLKKKGDDVRIDWGYFFIAAPALKAETDFDFIHPERQSASVVSAVILADPARLDADFGVGFFHSPGSVKTVLPAGRAPVPVVGLILSTTNNAPVSRWLLLAYDDEFSIQYFGTNLRPYWRSKGDDASALLKKSAEEYESLKRRCEQFDAELMSDLRQVGGEKYARLCALAYRQCYAANKVVDGTDGKPLMFPKENFSNGCIGTLDVIYPMAPQFLLFSPALTRAMLVPLLDYAVSGQWKFPFAPHDLGTYPLANGQVYGGGEKSEQNQMPVEETGNMLILLAALAQVEGNAHFCDPYWPILEKWADYLKEKGFDPENQLCTDDFAGHLAHNVNLSAKSICALAAFARLSELRGDATNAAAFRSLAEEFGQRWVDAASQDGHYRLAFDKPGTWSQKYNAVWDRILGLGLAPEGFWRDEMDFYKSQLNQYGLPLDNRKDYTKLDWTLWTATLTQDRSDFDALVDPVFRWVNETSSRVPLTDWYDTRTGRQVGFQARPVVGGVFLQMLYDRGLWNKWAHARN